MSEDALQRYDELMDASNAVADLVRSAKLDEQCTELMFNSLAVGTEIPAAAACSVTASACGARVRLLAAQGCAKTQSDLVIMPCGARILSLFCSPLDHSPRN